MIAMMEFGSDFHSTENFPHLENTGTEKWRDGIYYANGRQAINALIKSNSWKRIWIPAYFCYDVVSSIAKTGIGIEFYGDHPLADDSGIISRIPFRESDVLLRMNYFGLRDWRDNAGLGADVIEDHSHALNGRWVENSNADWCIASLRKSLPISEGGVLWSPKGLALPEKPPQSIQNNELSAKRLKAMQLKKEYLRKKSVDKAAFRELFIETENGFDSLPLSAISAADLKTISSIDIKKWNGLKKQNWEILNKALGRDMEILQPENDRCVPFSLIIRGQGIKPKLIEENIYPAILWKVPEEYDMDLLSLHCDGRYSADDMDIMIRKIRKCLS